MDVYLEIGNKRTFAGAIEWPGCCRSGRDEESALQILRTYATRYKNLLNSVQFEFQSWSDLTDFTVIERLKGDATTDFGAPGKIPASDLISVDATELRRFQELLVMCWQAFDTASSAALGQELRKGPRGGGRDLEAIIQHVLGADAAYLTKIGWNSKNVEENHSDQEFRRTRQAILDALAAAARGELPTKGPRAGQCWPPRYFVRRVAWHVLDHAWEIEDRIP